MKTEVKSQSLPLTLLLLTNFHNWQTYSPPCLCLIPKQATINKMIENVNKPINE